MAKFLVFMLLIMIVSVVTAEIYRDMMGKLHKRKITNRKARLCNVNYTDKRKNAANDPLLPTIYFVTATYPRPEQIAELTRQSHTLMHVPKVHWIVADDAETCSKFVLDLLTRTHLPFTQLACPKPDFGSAPSYVMPRGVSNRRAALNWIRQFVKEGILYFGDDDNTYDLRLFDEIRKTKKLSMVPVGLIGEYGVSSPVVKKGKVVAFFDSWPGHRVFPVDMAGFAVNIEHLKQQGKSAHMPYETGYLEDKFLRSAGFKIEDIEPMADNCTKVYVWHTQTWHNKKPILKANIGKISESNYESLGGLLKEIYKTGLVNVYNNFGIDAAITCNRSNVTKVTYLGDLDDDVE